MGAGTQQTERSGGRVDSVGAKISRHAGASGSCRSRLTKATLKRAASPSFDSFATRNASRSEIFGLNASFLEPDRNMNQQIINETPDRRKHSAWRRVHEVENILRPRPFRQHSLNPPFS